MRTRLNPIITLTCFLLAIQSCAHAQIPIRIGIDAGINFANQHLSRDNINSQSNRRGLIIGGLAEIGVSDLVSVQVEPRYIEEGTNTKATYLDASPEGHFTVEEDFKLSYIDFPLLLKAKFGTADVKPVVFVGPSVGFLLSAVYNQNARSIQGRDGLDGYDITDHYNSVDVSLDAGAGIEYRATRIVSLTGSARYSLGLSNISSHNISGVPDDQIKSNGIQITFGILLDL
jgi:hypothetical protein